METETTKLAQAQRTALAVCAFTMVLAGTALAQAADPLGVSTVATAATATFKVLGGIAIVWGFFRMMSGRHTVEGLVTLGVGALGIAKADTITGLLGLS